MENEDDEHEENKDDYRLMTFEWLEPEPNFLFTELSENQEARVRNASRYGQLHTWSLKRFIIKSGDDLRLE